MVTDLWHRLRALFRRDTVEAELRDELRFHLERHAEKLVAAGVPPTEAARRARLALGGVEQIKEECRQARGVSLAEGTWRDLRHALRGLRRTPGFTAVVVLSLALGIGANTAIFSLLDAVMWRMLPVRDPQHLSLLARTGNRGTAHGFSYGELRRLRAHDRSFGGQLAAWSTVRVNVSIDGRSEPTAPGQLVSGNYFATLGVPPVIGRAIGPEDDRHPDTHPVAMISHRYWKSRFARDPSVIGRRITLGGRTFTIVGVTPPEFFGLEVGTAPDLFAPMMMQPTLMPASENLLGDPIVYSTWVKVFGRLQPGVTPGQAAAHLDAAVQPDPRMTKLVALMRAENPKLVVLPAATGMSALRNQFSQPLSVLMAVVALVLLIACSNTANLMLARFAARRPEFAMRAALGASRGRLVRQVLTESMLLALLGGAAGILLAPAGTELLVAFMSVGQTPVHLDLTPDARVLGFTTAVSVLTGIAFGLVPALRAGGPGVVAAVKASPGRTGGAARVLPLGRILAVAQVALSLLLLVGAGVFLASLRRLDGQDGDFPRDRVLTVRVEPRGSDQRSIPGTSGRLDRLYRDLIRQVGTLPGVRHATMAHGTPTSPAGTTALVAMPGREETRVATSMVYPGYFATMGIPVIAGRDLTWSDLDESAPFVGVVNEAFVRQHFPGENPVGKRFTANAGRGTRVPREIVGVVKDSRYASLRGEARPLVYQPFLQTNTGRGQMVLHVRAADRSPALATRIREAVQNLDRTLPVFTVRTLSDEMDAVLVRERLTATLSGVFGALALLLACVGLHGLFAFAVVQRTPEIGVRMALGASHRAVLWMILREALSLVALGAAIGLAAALALGILAARALSGLLYRSSATDPAALAAATAVLAAAALLAVYLPARRASRADPMVALRAE